MQTNSGLQINTGCGPHSGPDGFWESLSQREGPGPGLGATLTLQGARVGTPWEGQDEESEVGRVRAGRILFSLKFKIVLFMGFRINFDLKNVMLK